MVNGLNHTVLYKRRGSDNTINEYWYHSFVLLFVIKPKITSKLAELLNPLLKVIPYISIPTVSYNINPITDHKYSMSGFNNFLNSLLNTQPEIFILNTRLLIPPLLHSPKGNIVHRTITLWPLLYHVQQVQKSITSRG